MSSIWVPGEPVAKGRPRMGRGGRVYTPDSTRQAERRIARAWWAPPIEADTPVQVIIEAHMKRPAAHYKKNGELTALGKRLPVPMKRPDLDNVVKLVLDALNTVAYVDDAQVQIIMARRQWAAQQGEGLRIVVRPVPLSGSVSL